MAHDLESEFDVLNGFCLVCEVVRISIDKTRGNHRESAGGLSFCLVGISGQTREKKPPMREDQDKGEEGEEGIVLACGPKEWR